MTHSKQVVRTSGALPSSSRPFVSVLTPTIPGRENLCIEAAKTVKSQTFPYWEHLIALDDEQRGCAWMCNHLAEHARGEWLFLLADDDLLLPGCLDRHMEATADADIVYAPPLVWGEDPAQFVTLPPPNIPSTSLIRADLWRALGGYNADLARTEDRDFYERAMLREARFVRIDKAPCWIYRFHNGNKSRQPTAS